MGGLKWVPVLALVLAAALLAVIAFRQRFPAASYASKGVAKSPVISVTFKDEAKPTEITILVEYIKSRGFGISPDDLNRILGDYFFYIIVYPPEKEYGLVKELEANHIVQKVDKYSQAL